MCKGAKPIVKIYLLPAEWGEKEFQNCFNRLLAGARSVNRLKVETENDFIVLFPNDRMMKGLGTEVVIVVDVPAPPFTQDLADEIASMFFEVMRQQLPDAHIQCNVNKLDILHGFCVSGVDD